MFMQQLAVRRSPTEVRAVAESINNAEIDLEWNIWTALQTNKVH